MGYGGKYGQQYGLDEPPAGAGAVAFERTNNDLAAAIDTVRAHPGPVFQVDEVVTAVDTLVHGPRAFERFGSDTVVATDGFTPDTAAAKGDRVTSPEKHGPYEPVIDLNMVEARLTNRSRYYLARGIHDGTLLQPVRYELGTGWENPRWGEPPKPSPDSTEVANFAYEGSIYNNRMLLEEANASTLVIRCEGPVEPSFNPTEVMIYAQIRNSSNSDENYREIPFANATFPSWFHTTNQQFTSRIVVPLGVGARVPSYQAPPQRIVGDTVTAIDTVTVVVA